MTKTLLTSIAVLTIATSACAAGPKRPEPARYVVCISDPANGGIVCNQTGDPADNYRVPFGQTENYRCMPEPDWIALEQELEVLRRGRRGD